MSDQSSQQPPNETGDDVPARLAPDAPTEVRSAADAPAPTEGPVAEAKAAHEPTPPAPGGPGAPPDEPAPVSTSADAGTTPAGPGIPPGDAGAVPAETESAPPAGPPTPPPTASVAEPSPGFGTTAPGPTPYEVPAAGDTAAGDTAAGATASGASAPGSSAVTSAVEAVASLFPADRPEVGIGAAFAAGFFLALILKRLAR